jgi:hypothetical protein
MPIEMHPVAARRIIRLAFGTALALWVSQTMNWGLSFITPVLLSMLLALPLPALNFKQSLKFVLALAVPVWLATWLLLPLLTYQPAVGMLLLIAACFWSFYYSTSGGSPVLGAFLTVGLAIVAAIGSVSIEQVIAVNKALTLNAVIGITMVALAYSLFPDLPPDGPQQKRPQAEPPTREAAIRSAWRSTAIVLPVIVFFLYYSESSSYLVVMIKVASMGQQAENDNTKAVGRSLLMSTFIGGVGAVIMWNLLSIWPSLVFYTLLVVLSGLIVGRRVFQGPGMTPNAGMWSYAFLTMLVVIGPAVLDGAGGAAAGVKFMDRLMMLSWATLYGVAAVYVFDAFWHSKARQTVVE